MASQLFQIVPNFKGTNAAALHLEEMEKYRTSGARFVILSGNSHRRIEIIRCTYEHLHKCTLYSRSDQSITKPALRRIVRNIYRGYLVPCYITN